MKHAGYIKREHRVYLIETLPVIRLGLKQFIDRQTDLMVCGESNNICNALKAIEDSNTDIVITDLSLGNGNGVVLSEDIVKKFSGIPLLVFSINDEFIFAERCLRAGARGYVMKTEPPEKIISAIRTVLKGEIYVGRQVQYNLLNNYFYTNSKVDLSPIKSLSNRELEVLQLMGQGLKAKQIADELNLSVKTIETHTDRIKKKLNLKNTRELIIHAVHLSATTGLK